MSSAHRKHPNLMRISSCSLFRFPSLAAVSGMDFSFRLYYSRRNLIYRRYVMDPRELLLICFAAYINNGSLSVNISEESIWDALMELAVEQKLLPVVFDVLHDQMPESVSGRYRSSAILQVARQTAHSAEFLEVYDRLLKEQFRPLVVKGIVVRTGYDRPDLRISADEDLYISKEDYMRFHETMQSLGFQTSAVPDMKNAHEERYLRHSFLIEGHWELFPQDHALLDSLNGLTEEFWSRAETITVEHVPLLTLEPTDHMSFLLLHAFKHFIGSGFGIRQIGDIAQWAKTHDIDWVRVRKALAPVRAELFAGAVLDIGSRYFGMSFPAGWERPDSDPLLQDALSAGVYGASTMSRKHSSTITLGAVESGYRKKRALPLRSSLFPNRAVMEMSFPWVKRTALLLPAAWAIRIGRYLRERGKDNSSLETIRIGKERTELLQYYRII